MRLPEVQDATLHYDAGVLTLTMNRDDVRNILTSTALAADIEHVCRWAASTDELSVLIITGAGKAFSAGGNIHDMHRQDGMFAGDGVRIRDNYRRGIQSMAAALYQLDLPTIAAVNGAAIGAGLDLSCMCDVRIAARSARMGETFVKLGLIPGDGGSWFLPRLVGPQRAAELSFSGRIISAEEAVAMGLFLEVVDDQDLMARARSLAADFASAPRSALRQTKRLLQQSMRMTLVDFLDFCAAQQALLHHSVEHRNEVAATITKLEKR